MDRSGATWPVLLCTGGPGQWVLHSAAGTWPRGSPGVHPEEILEAFWVLGSRPDSPAEIPISRAGQWRVTPPVVWPSAHPSYQGIPSAPWCACSRHPPAVLQGEGQRCRDVCPWRRQWTVCSITSALASSIPHSLSMRWWGQLPLRTRQSVLRRENPPESYWSCRIVCRTWKGPCWDVPLWGPHLGA